MGVYYFFYNKRTKAENTLPIPGYGKCWFVANLDSIDGLEEIFKSVILINSDLSIEEKDRWLPTDVIIAHPDYEYHCTIIYDNGNLSYSKVEDSQPLQLWC